MYDEIRFCLTNGLYWHEATIMAKGSAGRQAEHGSKRPSGGLPKGGAGRTKVSQRNAKKRDAKTSVKTGDAVLAGAAMQQVARIEAVMRAAEQSGLLHEKSSRIGGRVSPALVRQAKRQTGLKTDTDLIEFALATVALEDNFAEAFKESRGQVDPALKLGF
jgi:hypothetical protein